MQLTQEWARDGVASRPAAPAHFVTAGEGRVNVHRDEVVCRNLLLKFLSANRLAVAGSKVHPDRATTA